MPAFALGVTALLAARRLTGRQSPDPIASPGDHDLPFENISFLSADGVTLRGWFIPAPAGTCKGTIIFCHGHTGSMDPDLKYVPAFRQHGYNVLMFDFRGHGRSGGHLISLGYYERQDVLAAIRFLRQRGIEEVGLLGFSMGGSIAMISAPLSPAVRAVVSDSGFATIDTTVSGWLRQKGIPDPISTLVAKVTIGLASLRLGCSLKEAYPIHWVDKISPRGLLIIQGERDIFVSVRDARALYERAGEPKALWIQPGAGHREIDEVAWEAYLCRILEFFDQFFPG